MTTNVRGGDRPVDLATWAGVPEEQFVARFVRNAEAFLETRNLSLPTIDTVVRDQIEDVQLVLVTSSPVHGLANSTSDIDTIAVTTPGCTGSRMATQVFVEGNHIETMQLASDAIEQDIGALVALDGCAPPSAVGSLARWDKERRVRRKYLERVINGVATDGTMPFRAALPSLARAWAWASLDVAAVGAVHATLSRRADERRAPYAYAHATAIHLADVVLSHHGTVFSNKKWFLLRWARFHRDGPIRTGWSAAVDAVDGFLLELADAICGRRAHSIDLMWSAVDAVAAAAGTAVASAVRIHDLADHRLPFLPGSDIVLVGDRAAALRSTGTEASGALDRVALLGLDPAASGDLLARSRIGAVDVRPW